jgi:hypothetical protein
LHSRIKIGDAVALEVCLEGRSISEAIIAPCSDALSNRTGTCTEKARPRQWLPRSESQQLRNSSSLSRILPTKSAASSGPTPSFRSVAFPPTYDLHRPEQISTGDYSQTKHIKAWSVGEHASRPACRDKEKWRPAGPWLCALKSRLRRAATETRVFGDWAGRHRAGESSSKNNTRTTRNEVRAMLTCRQEQGHNSVDGTRNRTCGTEVTRGNVFCTLPDLSFENCPYVNWYPKK